MKKININDSVLIKLTPHGINVLRERWNEVFHDDPEYPFKPPDVDENGYSQMQLWDVMNRFGSNTYCGSDLCFEVEILLNA